MSGAFILFHPSVAPFVQQAALALHEAGRLERFYTTIRDNPTDLLQRTACATSAVLGKKLHAQFARRRVVELPAQKITAYPLGEFVRLASSALDASGRLTDVAWEWSEIRFSRKVARHLYASLTGVYGFEFSALAVFEKARQLGLRTVYDVPAPEPTFVEKLLQSENDQFPDLKTKYTAHTAKREERRTAHRRREWDLAERVIAASNFTRDSFVSAGRDVSKLRVVPYGAPPVAPVDEALPPTRQTGPARFVWAGTFSVRKGAHYLLEAWRAGGLGRFATLDVYGSITLPERIIYPTPEGIRFHGPIAREELLRQFRQADALVFPTLCDGFGMVVTEAWSQGLPVITTARAGAADLMRDGQNGILVSPGNAESLATTLSELSASPERLHVMREAARQTAADWQWSDYRRALIEALF